MIIELRGGLGNQMFQYALALSLKYKLGIDVKLDSFYYKANQFRSLGLGIFNTKLNYAENWERDLYPLSNVNYGKKIIRKVSSVIVNRTIYIEDGLQFHPEVFNLSKFTYIRGYWHNEKYFNEIEDLVREHFRFNHNSKLTINSAIADLINASESVSIHIRRGDYVQDKAVSALNGVLDLQYYHNAIRIIQERLVNPYLFIFSDDPEWVKKNLELKCQYQIVNNNSGLYSYEDMRLMSICKHHIIANSSFSWWGAWLNPSKEKIVIAPQQWYANTIVNQQVINIAPSTWMRL